jgi:riboflavin kinase/FMN adenylyltransferase
VAVAGSGFRFGRDRAGDLGLLRRLGIDVRAVPLVEGISSTQIRRLVAAGEVEHAARLLGRPVEVEGTVVGGDHRGTGLGFPTANVEPPPHLLVPANGIYAGGVGDVRAAVLDRREPALRRPRAEGRGVPARLAADLYGKRLVVQLRQRLRDERAFGSEAELVEQIGQDVEATRAAIPCLSLPPKKSQENAASTSLLTWWSRMPSSSQWSAYGASTAARAT